MASNPTVNQIGISAVRYRHPAQGEGFLISWRLRRDGLIAFTLLTEQGKRLIVAKSLEEQEWIPAPHGQ